MEKNTNKNKKDIRGIQLFSVGEACRKLSISRPTLNQLVAAYSAVNAYTPKKVRKMVRYSEQDLINFIEFDTGPAERRTPGRSPKVATVKE